MAALFAILFVYSIGMLICRGIDKANVRAVKRDSAERKSYKQLIADVYVVAWPIYKRFEDEAVTKWKELHDGLPPPSTSSRQFIEFAVAQYGIAFPHEAIRQAIQLLREHNKDVPAVAYSAKERCKAIHADQAYDVNDHIAELVKRVPLLWEPYHDEQADLITDPWIASFIPASTP